MNTEQTSKKKKKIFTSMQCPNIMMAVWETYLLLIEVLSAPSPMILVESFSLIEGGLVGEDIRTERFLFQTKLVVWPDLGT